MVKPTRRVVLDTNVIISGLWNGPPRKIVDNWQEGEIQVIVSQEILTEYLRVLARFNLPPETEDDFLLLFIDPARTVFVKPPHTALVIKEDPADNKFLSCALEGKADYIVSGDHHLLQLSCYKMIPIITPREFVSDRDTDKKEKSLYKKHGQSGSD
ncbi:MAG: putative toxin-antitoxin system toxin component, PIN family [Candidatus Omnitrophota bacterium]|nr:putative toxin-antitoxin system toxin component, PIN family [Candidatus Omnitrophota bacterium]